MKLIDKEFFARNTLEVARRLLGMKLIYGECEGMIVETEAYRDDPASHAVTKPQKGKMLIETYGCIYIFFIYGMYHCLNFTTEKDGIGAVLIRAVEPLSGIETMQSRRKISNFKNISNGPGKLFIAFGLHPSKHGERVGDSIHLQKHCKFTDGEIVTTSRIGISKATDLPWRFCVNGSEFLSKS